MLNRVFLMGRLTADPVMRHTQNNTPVTSFTLAVDRNFSRNNETDFFDIVSWNKNAEFVSNYFHKGQLVVVSGRLQVRSWTDKDGNNRRTYEIVADETYFADSKRNSSNDGMPTFEARPSQNNYTASPVQDEDTSGFSDLSVDDDELPF